MALRIAGCTDRENAVVRESVSGDVLVQLIGSSPLQVAGNE